MRSDFGRDTLEGDVAVGAPVRPRVPSDRERSIGSAAQGPPAPIFGESVAR
jgi:hypothetical protein